METNRTEFVVGLSAEEAALVASLGTRMHVPSGSALFRLG